MWGWVLSAKRLLLAGADLNAININGRTCLMFAVEYAHMGMVEFLLSRPTLHLNAQDAEGSSALILAITIGQKGLEILQLLLTNKADAELVNAKGKCALQLACEAQNMEQVGVLFDHNVTRREDCLALLEGNALQVVRGRMKEEERQVVEAYERQLREAAVRERDGLVDLRGEDPRGRWILFNDKRGTGQFYYNSISRESRRKQPLDYVADPTKPVRDVTMGMHFYHQ
jgi:hypothetical protein